MFGKEKSPVWVIIKAAFEEARLRGDRRMGTEHLLLGLLHHDASARALGVDVAAARAALDELDRAALRMLGLEIGDAPKTPRKHPAVPNTALTSSARAVLNAAIKATTRKTRDAETPRHLALGLLAQTRPDPAAQVIDQLGLDRAAIRARVA
ncbi:Clp amino terminal domain-containing protein, pathogenicity island component [Nonomuraea solani]|uniref:Clp amino terminal domain-containing protein, pathogenicity island component n=1 Tax=Nonomuraea solani TaxID=1144553 RepID=A0A1H6BVD2_9ACTN|nr:Clp protease N-terminal domain-containing protein [Nonomuraea solani]SEG64592.1 Clp amino terminal domain-containing protein, pathogenicity island component [Nonomuraea solani]